MNQAGQHDEVREAAERLRRYKAKAPPWEVYGGNKSQWTIGNISESVCQLMADDLEVLGAAYLAEHPADSEQPITEDWLLSVGFERTENYGMRLEYRKPYGEDTATFHLAITDRDNLLDCPWEIWVQSIELNLEGAMLPCEPQTRGDVRRLATALGITLREGPAT